MDRIAVVAPASRLPAVVAAVGASGLVEPDLPTADEPGIAGELSAQEVAAAAFVHGDVAAFAGWCPSAGREALAEALAPLGGGVALLPMPRAAEAPTMLGARGERQPFQPLVDIYATIPYADVNPALFAGLAYILMFGMMFGDVGHGALLLAGGFVVWRRPPVWAKRYRAAAPFLLGAGASSVAFGFAYGEAFGPTGLLPALWLEPLRNPVTLLLAAVSGGAVLLAVSYALGTVNRWRESGFGGALLALSGIAGSVLYLGFAMIAAGSYTANGALATAGIVACCTGLLGGYAGLYLETSGAFGGALVAGVELFDAVVRLGTNTISFARLAAFGLTHAALGQIVWNGTVALAERGAVWMPAAAVVFVAGNAAAFLLEALVAGIQALRLDYYELFSRIFISTGRPFTPWRVPVAPENGGSR